MSFLAGARGWPGLCSMGLLARDAQTHVQGPGALQPVVSLSNAASRGAARGGMRINLPGWPAARWKPPSLWKMRALFQDLPSRGWDLGWTGSLPQECRLHGGSLCSPLLSAAGRAGDRERRGGPGPAPLGASE